jgi:hypothetical protein
MVAMTFRTEDRRDLRMEPGDLRLPQVIWRARVRRAPSLQGASPIGLEVPGHVSALNHTGETAKI